MGDEPLKVDVTLPATSTVGPFWIDSRSRRPPGTPFSLLPRTTVMASESASLREVLGQAGAVLGVGALQMDWGSEQTRRSRRRWPLRREPNWEEITSDPRNLDPDARFESHLRFAAFVLPEDEENGPAVLQDKRLNLTRTAIVDSSGRARWDVTPLDAHLRDLVSASEAGLLDGDPLRPYLIVAVPAGDLGVVGADWSTFEDALRITWDVISAFGVAYSAAQGVRAIRDRLGGAKKVIESRRRTWSERGGRPSDLPDVLGARPRRASEVGGLLGCSNSEAEALLWGLGFEVDEDGLWQVGDDPSAEALGPVRQLLLRAGTTTTEEVRQEAQQAMQGVSDRKGKPSLGQEEAGEPKRGSGATPSEMPGD